MSTVSSSGRGILNGLPEGGYPQIASRTTTHVLHTAVEGVTLLDTIYVYGYVCRQAVGSVSAVKVEISVQDKNNNSYTLTSTTIPGLPCTSPTLLLNGHVKNNSCRIRVTAVDGDVATFGWYNRTTVRVPPSVNTIVGQLTMGHQTLAFGSDNEARVVDAAAPLTFVSTSHTTASQLCIATLGPAQIGTMKYIVFVSKHPAATLASQGNFKVVPSAAVFPAGEGGPAAGTLTFQDVGDSAILVWSGSAWMLVGTGAIVDQA